MKPRRPRRSTALHPAEATLEAMPGGSGVSIGPRPPRESTPSGHVPLTSTATYSQRPRIHSWLVSGPTGKVTGRLPARSSSPKLQEIVTTITVKLALVDAHRLERRAIYGLEL